MKALKPGALPLALLGVLGAVFLISATPAFAESPWWQLSSGSIPTNLAPGSTDKIQLVATNLGDGEVNGAATTVTVTDELPVGLTATAISGKSGPYNDEGQPEPDGPVECTLTSLSCTFAGKLPPYERLWIDITVEVTPGVAANVENEARITGGGAPSVIVKRPLNISSAPTAFGVEDYEMVPEEEGGAVDTQAGSHPFQLTSTIALNQTPEKPHQPAQPKDQHFYLPAGLVGNPTPFPQCTNADFAARVIGQINSCPNDTAIGVAMITSQLAGEGPGAILGLFTRAVPLFNLEPSVGEPARFGFEVSYDPVILDTAVRTGGDYGVTVNVSNITELPSFLAARVTFWGVPGDPSHDNSRGWDCLPSFTKELGGCAATPSVSKPPPFLTMPTSCSAPFETSVTTDSWSEPSVLAPPVSFLLQNALGEPVALGGCNRLPFGPSISVAPDAEAASKPSGLSVDVHVPQEVSQDAGALSEANVKDTTVTLPQGVTLNPAGANNLEACSEAQIGFEGVERPSEIDRFSASEPSCPDASKIATVTIHSPLLPNPLQGEVYLAAQNANPFGSLVAQYLVAKDPVSGVLIKLAGEVSLNQGTGQITATFENSPDLPFEDLELHFFGGERAPLSTPARCGTYTTLASMTPWSDNPPAEPTSSFAITSGPDGSPCPGASLPFAPSFTGGTTNIQAGAFSTLDTVMSREDGNQNLQAVTLHTPPGLSGLLSAVKLCGEAQADAGTCGPESLIGHTTVSVGLGGDPYTVTGGEVFITGPYQGAPFGLSIVNPAVAGPFNLGKVIVRAKIEVDPHTAALTVTTDNTGQYKIPQILDGIPLQIKHIAVTIDRPGFTFNPTSCHSMAITGTLSGAEGASSPLNIPFQVANCANLKFEPKFAVSTSGKTSKANGASLTAKLSYPNTPQGSEANIARVKVDLPKQLPSRLTTLQKACTNAQFEANPADCPAASKIGYATVTTPLLPVPLTGPAIFVSHGGEAFPSLTMVLQGYGVTVDLVGTTFISHAGITSTTFKTVPDTPFNTFQLTLPEGPYSALAANGNLCNSKLAMPTEFVGQNGAVIHQSTPLTAEGCSASLAFTHSIKKKTLTLHVYVPAAGKLTASGKGLTTASKTAKGQEDITVTLKQKNAGKLKTTVKVAFTPNTGKDRKKQSKNAKLRFEK
ncbi:MAG TPA: hypothetical protein VGL37_07685 [Solirubrobacteraceae bacterium]